MNSTYVENKHQQLYLNNFQQVFIVTLMTLGTRIRFYREKVTWTLEQLSEKSGVDVGTISALENRESTKSKYAGQIAAAFGLTVDQLIDPSRDWLDAAHLKRALREVATARWQDPQPTWPFSDDLYAAVNGSDPARLRHLENILRAALDLPYSQPHAQAHRP